MNSVDDSIFINNVCYVAQRSNLVTIGDIVEVRNNYLFTDLFVTVCNVMAQCKLSIIRKI